MTSLPSAFQKFRFDSDTLPLAQRHSAVREVIGHQMGLDVDIFADVPLHISFNFLSLPGLQTFSGDTAAVAQRTPRYIADGTDLVGFALCTRQSFFLSQRGQEHVVESGAGCLLSWSDPSLMRSMIGDRSGCIGILLPRSTLAPLVKNLDDACGRLIPGGNEALSLLVKYLGALQGISGFRSVETAQAVVRHIHDLTALAIGTSRDATAFASARGLRVARLLAIKSYIVGNSRRHDLSVGGVAQHHHLTERYVQRLFEADGTTFSSFLLELRLHRAHGFLSDPQFAGNAVGLIAYECGFHEISYFNRAFKRRYGASPTEIRKESRTG